METISATQFRSALFKTLKKVLMGFEVTVKTKDGNILMVDERNFLNKGESRSVDLSKPKAKGAIIGSLDNADQLLREYIQVPKK